MRIFRFVSREQERFLPVSRGAVFVDDNVVALGIHRTGEANWRMPARTASTMRTSWCTRTTRSFSQILVLPLGIRPASEEHHNI